MFIRLETTLTKTSFKIIDDDFDDFLDTTELKPIVHTVADFYKTKSIPVGINIIKYLQWFSIAHNKHENNIKWLIRIIDTYPEYDEFKQEYYNTYKKYLTCL